MRQRSSPTGERKRDSPPPKSRPPRSANFSGPPGGLALFDVAERSEGAAGGAREADADLKTALAQETLAALQNIEIAIRGYEEWQRNPGTHGRVHSMIAREIVRAKEAHVAWVAYADSDYAAAQRPRRHYVDILLSVREDMDRKRAAADWQRQAQDQEKKSGREYNDIDGGGGDSDGDDGRRNVPDEKPPPPAGPIRLPPPARDRGPPSRHGGPLRPWDCFARWPTPWEYDDDGATATEPDRRRERERRLQRERHLVWQRQKSASERSSPTGEAALREAEQSEERKGGGGGGGGGSQ